LFKLGTTVTGEEKRKRVDNGQSSVLGTISRKDKLT